MTHKFSKVEDLVSQEAGQSKVVGPLNLLSKGDFPNLHAAQVAKGISVVGVVIALVLIAGWGDAVGMRRGCCGREGFVWREEGWGERRIGGRKVKEGLGGERGNAKRR